MGGGTNDAPCKLVIIIPFRRFSGYSVVLCWKGAIPLPDWLMPLSLVRMLDITGSLDVFQWHLLACVPRVEKPYGWCSASPKGPGHRLPDLALLPSRRRTGSVFYFACCVLLSSKPC